MARPKGSMNKRTAEADEICRKLKCDPFEVLILFAKGDWKALGYDAETYVTEKADGSYKMGYTISPETRMAAAAKATPFIYATKKTPEQDQTDKLMRIVLEDYTKKDPK